MTVCKTTESFHPYSVLLGTYSCNGKRLRNVISVKYGWPLTKMNALQHWNFKLLASVMVNQLVHLGRFRSFQCTQYEVSLEQERELTELVINVYSDFYTEITGFDFQRDKPMSENEIGNLEDLMNLSRIVLLNLDNWESRLCPPVRKEKNLTELWWVVKQS